MFVSGIPCAGFERVDDIFPVVGVERGVSGDGQQLAVIPRVGTHHHFVVEEGEGDVAGIQDIFAWNHYQVRSCYIIR